MLSCGSIPLGGDGATVGGYQQQYIAVKVSDEEDADEDADCSGDDGIDGTDNTGRPSGRAHDVREADIEVGGIAMVPPASSPAASVAVGRPSTLAVAARGSKRKTKVKKLAASPPQHGNSVAGTEKFDPKSV